MIKEATVGSVDEIRWNLALANRILARHKVVDAFGHVSQRSPFQDGRFFMARCIAPGTVTSADIVELDFEGDNVDPKAPISYGERFIHAEIYRARPDVMAVVHSHSPSVLPFTIVRGTPFRCVCHTAGFIGASTPVFEIRDVAGDATDLLIKNSELGVALAKCLGDSNVVLMRGHGSTAVGGALPQAVFHAVFAEVNAKVQAEAMRLGPVTYFTEGENKAADFDKSARAWELWVSEVENDLR